MAKLTKQPAVRRSIGSSPQRDFYRSPNGPPDLKAVAERSQDGKELGYLRRRYRRRRNTPISPSSARRRSGWPGEVAHALASRCRVADHGDEGRAEAAPFPTGGMQVEVNAKIARDDDAARVARCSVPGPRPAQADPVKFRIGWIAMPASRAGYLLEKPELLHHLNQSYTIEPMHFSNDPGAVHGAGLRRSRHRAARLFDARRRGRERPYGGCAAHRRRARRWQARLVDDAFHRAQGQPDQDDRRFEGQGCRDQRHRHRSRHRAALCPPAASSAKRRPTTPMSRSISRT